MICRKTMRNFVGQWYHVKQWQKFCTETLKNVFSNAKKMASKNIFRPFFCANFFMFALLISNHTVFLVQFEINLYLWFFPKSHYTRQRGSCNFSFLKNSLVQIPNWTRNRMITFTNSTAVFLCYLRDRQASRQKVLEEGRVSTLNPVWDFFFFLLLSVTISPINCGQYCKYFDNNSLFQK